MQSQETSGVLTAVENQRWLVLYLDGFMTGKNWFNMDWTIPFGIAFNLIFVNIISRYIGWQKTSTRILTDSKTVTNKFNVLSIKHKSIQKNGTNIIIIY